MSISNPSVNNAQKRRGKMRNCLVAALLLTLTLSASSYAEGQTVVDLSAHWEKDPILNVNTTVATSEKWIAFMGSGVLAKAYKRETWEKRYLRLERKSPYGLSSVGMVLIEDFLVSAGAYGRQGTVGIWNLNNLTDAQSGLGSMPDNPDGSYHFQNWEIKDDGGLWALWGNPKRRVFGFCNADSGRFSVYRIPEGGGEPIHLQDFFVDESLIYECKASGDFLAVGRIGKIVLFKFNASVSQYEKIASFDWSTYVYSNSKTPEKDLGITVGKDGFIYVLRTSTSAPYHAALKINPSTFRVLQTIPYGDPDYTSPPYIFATDGDFAIIGRTKDLSMVLHVPSGQFIGSVKRHTHSTGAMSFLVSMRDMGNEVEIITAESPLYNLNYPEGVLSYYKTPVYTVSVPKKKKIVGGTVELISSSRVFPGGSATFVVTAEDGKRVWMIREWSSSKKIVKKRVASLIYRIKKIKSDSGLKKARFSNANMRKYSVWLPYITVIGRPDPEEEDPQWYYDLSVGKYIGFQTSTTTGIITRYFKITVTKKGGVTTAELK